MVSKEEREEHLEILSRASKRPWFLNEEPDYVGEDRCAGISSSEEENTAVVVTDSGVYPPTRNDAEALVCAVNEIEGYIADAAEMDRRIAEVEHLAESSWGTSYDGGALLTKVVAILRGEP